MSINHNRIRVADLEINEANKILITNSDGELEFVDINNTLDCTLPGNALDARQGKVLKDLVDNINALLTSDNANLNTIQKLVDATTNIQTQLNSKALDANVLHKTDNESWTGIKSSTNTGATSVNGLSLTNNGTAGNATSLSINNTNTGRGFQLTNTGTGSGQVTVNSTTGIGQYLANSAGGIGYSTENSSTGAAYSINSLTGSTGNSIEFKKNGVTNLRIDSEGMLRTTNTGSTSTTGIAIVNSGAAATQVVSISNTAGGRGLLVTNGSTGAGIVTANNGAGNGVYVNNGSTGSGYSLDNQSTGIAFYLNSATGSTGDLLRFQKNSSTTAKFDQLGIFTSNPSVTASGGEARGMNISPTLTAAANNDVLTAIRINPTYNQGAFTGVTNLGLYVNGAIKATSNGNDLVLMTGNNDIAFRAVRANAHADNVSTQFFQIGNAVDKAFLTSYQGNGFSRLSFSSITTQFTTAGYLSALTPTGIFEISDASNRYFNVFSSGRISLGSIVDNGVDKLQVNGTISASPATTFNQVVVKSQLDASVRPYKVYTALLTQTGTSAPTAIVLENTLGVTISWSYTSTGFYTFTSSANIFTTNKTIIFTTKSLAGSFGMAFNANISSFTSGDIIVSNSSGLMDNSLSNASIEIRVYS
ncbi:hypothetical protein [Flavobacterium aquiphilum]|uniref:hypothetical protein n=1 Tax=Flavobacterium aquiphilum TaxID=3003261 RepID=UPI002480D7E4|nr:hypothetical protein [Flavobacterium aquiphilum]